MTLSNQESPVATVLRALEIDLKEVDEKCGTKLSEGRMGEGYDLQKFLSVVKLMIEEKAKKRSN